MEMRPIGLFILAVFWDWTIPLFIERTLRDLSRMPYLENAQARLRCNSRLQKYNQICDSAESDPKMELTEEKYLRRAKEAQTKFSILPRHTRKREEIITSCFYQLAVSLVCVFFRLRRVWLSLFSLAFPLVLFCFLDSHDARFRCLYVVFVMVSSWLTAANDPVLVAIYPIVLCPLLGVAGVKTLAGSYFRPVSFLMLGTSLVAAAFSRTGLDTTISTVILNKFTPSPPLLCLGLMFCSATLSMWINNASTAVILSPIATRILAGWTKRLRDEGHSQETCSGFEKNVDVQSICSNPLAPPALYGSLPGLKSRASTSADAVCRVVPSKEANAADVEMDHMQADTNVLPRADVPRTRRREVKRRTDLSDETAFGAKTNNVEATAALTPSLAMREKQPAQKDEKEGAPSAARLVSDAGAALEGPESKYCDAASSTSLSSVEGDRVACQLRYLHNVVFLGIAYSATLGGMSTLNGSFVSPTLVYVLESSYNFDPSGGQQNPINFTSWMAFACPLALLCVFLAWLVLSSVWLGISATAQAVLRLLVHPFRVLLATVRLVAGHSRRLTRKVLPNAAHSRATGGAHDGFPAHTPTGNVAILNNTGAVCSNSEDIEAPDDSVKGANSASSPAIKSDAVVDQAERSPSSVADVNQRRCRSFTLAATPSAPLKTSHLFAQMEVLVLLAALISLWLTRSAGGNANSGWGAFFVPTFVDDSVPVLLLGLFLFFLPLEPPSFAWNCLCCKLRGPGYRGKNALLKRETLEQPDNGSQTYRDERFSDADGQPVGRWSAYTSAVFEQDEEEVELQEDVKPINCYQRFRQECKRKAAQKKEYKPILTYAYAVKHIEWGALLLLGGGFAMATCIKETGLDLWIGNALLRFATFDRPALVASVLLISSGLTEVMSNTATANVLLPILSGVARQAKDSPLVVLIPATVGAQLAFMLPLGTAPNAIVLKKGKLRPLDMFWSGFLVKLFAIGTTVLAMMTWSDWLFDLKTRPAWAG